MNNLRNRVLLIGRLGGDPELQQVGDNRTLAKFNVATNDSYKTAEGEKVDETQWHRIIAWGKTGEFAHKYLKKGNEVALEGKLMHREYETNGDKKYITEVNVKEIVLIGKKD